MIQQSYSWAYIQKSQKLLIQKDLCTPRFIAALFTTAETWKQSKYQQMIDLRRCEINVI